MRIDDKVAKACERFEQAREIDRIITIRILIPIGVIIALCFAFGLFK